ncbi:hypothetical protein CLF_108237, partial [Clonorchis sinensis]
MPNSVSVVNRKPGRPNLILPEFKAWEDEDEINKARTYRPPHGVFIPRACCQICKVACHQAVLRGVVTTSLTSTFSPRLWFCPTHGGSVTCSMSLFAILVTTMKCLRFLKGRCLKPVTHRGEFGQSFVEIRNVITWRVAVFACKFGKMLTNRDVSRLQQSSNRTQFKRYRCGGRHSHPKDCRHTQTVCNRCKKRGHLAKVCRSAPAFETNAAVTNQVTRSEVPEYVLHAAAPTNRIQPPYQVELHVNSAPMVFEMDTGSAVTLCSEKSWQDNLRPTVKDKLQQAPVRLRTYTGEEVKLLGTKNVNVSYKGVTVNETIYIAEGNGPNLLGRDWLQQLPILTFDQVSTLPEVQSLIRNYEVFSEPKTGKFSGGKVNIYVPPGTQPRFLKARSLPYLMRPKVEEELNRLQREGIIATRGSDLQKAAKRAKLQQAADSAVSGILFATVNPGAVIVPGAVVVSAEMNVDLKCNIRIGFQGPIRLKTQLRHRNTGTEQLDRFCSATKHCFDA